MITESDIEKYLELKEYADSYKAKENKMRRELAHKIRNSKSPIDDKGRYNPIIEGYEVKLSIPTNIKIDDQDDLDLVYEDLSEEEQACFEIKYSLKTTEYKKFKEKYENGELEIEPDIFDYVTESEGMPKLEVKNQVII